MKNGNDEKKGIESYMINKFSCDQKINEACNLTNMQLSKRGWITIQLVRDYDKGNVKSICFEVNAINALGIFLSLTGVTYWNEGVLN